MIDADDIASVLVPVTVNDGRIVSITAGGVDLPEDSNPMWAPGTTYALGARVYSPVTHRVYESLKAGNVGKDPTQLVNQTTAAGIGTWWYNLGPTNKYAMFDGLISTQTLAASPLVIKIRAGASNGMAMFKVDADNVEVGVAAGPGGDTIFEYDDDMEGSEPADFYEYFFDLFKPKTQLVLTGIEPYSSSEFTITMTKATGPIKIGMLAFGDLRPLGSTERGAAVEPKTYAYIETDAYGQTRIVQRPSAVGLVLPIKLDVEDSDSVLETVQNLLDVPVAVIGSTSPLHTRLSTFGLISGSMRYDEYPYCVLNLTVKGFT